jgi:hypothetical protein
MPASGYVSLLDGKLGINGFFKETVYMRTSMQDREEPFHDNRFDFVKSSMLLEALYNLKPEGAYTVRLFGGFKYWYEASPRLDDNLRRHIPHRFRKDYISPRTGEEMISEAYAELVSDPWELRVGKQIVVWGDLDIIRTADVVNPLDLRTGVPGTDNWEEIKQGLWMMRLLYQSRLPGNLLFEGIFNPGDYQNMLLPDEGTHWGQPYHASNPFYPTEGFGAAHWLLEKMRRDAPGWSLTKNYEYGFRMRGYTRGVDWTIMYYNSRTDAPIADPNKVGGFFAQYLLAGIGATITGSTINPEWPGYRVFKYKRSQVVGGTAQMFAQKLHGSILKMEWFYEIGTPFNKGPRGSSSGVYEETRRDVLGIAFNYADKYAIPWFTQSRLCTGKQLEVSLTYFWEKIMNHDHDLVQDARYHRPGDSTADVITLFFMQAMFNQTINLVFSGSYYPHIDKWMAIPTFSYTFPGEHWRADFGCALYGGARNDYTRGFYAHKDKLIFRLRYEY